MVLFKTNYFSVYKLGLHIFKIGRSMCEDNAYHIVSNSFCDHLRDVAMASNRTMQLANIGHIPTFIHRTAQRWGLHGHDPFTSDRFGELRSSNPGVCEARLCTAGVVNIRGLLHYYSLGCGTARSSGLHAWLRHAFSSLQLSRFLLKVFTFLGSFADTKLRSKSPSYFAAGRRRVRTTEMSY